MRQLENRFYRGVLHSDARTAAALPAGSWDLDAFQDRSYCLVVSFRRNGHPVLTPVWFGVVADRLYFRTDAETGKVKRIRRNPRVRLAPCTARGRPLAAPIEGIARIVSGSDALAAEQALDENYGLGRSLYKRLLASTDALYVEVAADGAIER